MQVLYQLSYGPIGFAAPLAAPLASRKLTPQWGCHSHLAPHRHKLALDQHLVGVQFDRGIGRIGGLQTHL